MYSMVQSFHVALRFHQFCVVDVLDAECLRTANVCVCVAIYIFVPSMNRFETSIQYFNIFQQL